MFVESQGVHTKEISPKIWEVSYIFEEISGSFLSVSALLKVL